MIEIQSKHGQICLFTFQKEVDQLQLHFLDITERNHQDLSKMKRKERKVEPCEEIFREIKTAFPKGMIRLSIILNFFL